MWIERKITQQIQLLVLKRPALFISGASKSGKTSLLQKLFPKHHYVNLDLPNLAQEAKENGEYFLEKYRAPLIIDEIQYAPELFRFLKIEIDKHRNQYGRYILTGSQKFSLMSNVSESLSGRISILECHSLSASEILRHQIKTKKASKKYTTQDVLSWMLKGGYPEINAQDLSPARFYSDYTATYLQRDVRQIINLKDLGLFDKFMRLLALRSGQALSMSALASDIGVSTHTIKSWISALEASNIIYLLKPFYQNYGKRLTKSPKLYFLDTGLLCYLAGFQTIKDLESSPLLGSFFETFALGQLLRHFSNRGLEPNLYYFRDNTGLEVDFLIPEGTKLSLYECK